MRAAPPSSRTTSWRATADPDDSPVNARRRAAGALPANLILTRDGGDHLPRSSRSATGSGPPGAASWRCPSNAGSRCCSAWPRSTRRGSSPTASVRPRSRRTRSGRSGRRRTRQFDAALRPSQGARRARPRRQGADKRDVIAGDRRGVLRGADAACRPTSVMIAVTADHATSCVSKAHTADPVPLVVSGGPITPDGSESFGERACAAGSLGELRGPQILPRLSTLVR